MEKYLVYEDGEGFIVIDHTTKRVTRCTLDLQHATEMTLASATPYLLAGHGRRRFLFPVRHPEYQAPFAFLPGARVVKLAGDYSFHGIVVSSFRKLSGLPRFVVENPEGILHIFNDKILQPE